MPVLQVPESREQYLREHRRLLSPAEAAKELGVSRQAIDKAAQRAGGPYLMWLFMSGGGRDLRRVDFGATAEPADPRAWSNAESPEDLLEDPLPQGPAPVSVEAEVLLHLIATGLIELLEDRGAKAVVPYPRPLQRALDRMTVGSWRVGHSPPASVPALVNLCASPVRQLLPDLPPAAATDDDVLLADGEPTSYCREWAVPSSDVEGELLENRLMRGAISLCRMRGAENAYVKFRRLLIEKPVLSVMDIQQHCTDPELHFLGEAVRSAYAPVPVHHAIRGQVYCCRDCGHLIVAGPRRRRCSNDRCLSADAPAEGAALALSADPMWLRAPLRTFISLPGAAELRLAAELERLGVPRVELWPSFDAYDVRVTFDGGEVWAIDVKDWASPVALGRHLATSSAFRADPPWKRAFFVFPDQRLAANPEYIRVFRHFYRPGTVPIAALSETGLLRQVRRQMARTDGSADA